MFYKLRNRFLLLLMATVTILTVLFFSAIVGISYQNADNRSDELLERGFNMHEMATPENRINTDRFSPIFSVDVNSDGDIDAIHSNFDIDSEFYSNLAYAVESINSTSGKISYDDMTFKFKILGAGNGYRFIFLDISKDLQSIRHMIYSFLWISLPLLFLIFLMSKYFADRAIKPIRDSFERQNQFVADASHELKTPLASIGANASLLLANATPEQTKWLGFIKDETLRLEKLTSGLLYLSREPVTKPERSRCDLSVITNSVLIPLEAVIYEKQIECTSCIEKDINIMATEEQLHRLISIFIENAIKYTDNIICATLKKHGRNAVLTISNNGIGIPADDLDKIWDRFYRADKARQAQGGFGLGLATAKSIVNELGGTVSVSSTPGEMTTFTVLLPM